VEHAQAVERQAVGRAYRLGQDKVIDVARFIVKDTIEQEIFEMNSGLFAQQLLADVDRVASSTTTTTTTTTTSSSSSSSS